ncbi:MAG: hypothetical protein H5T69_13160 [Chloroflexi bacterium]|nr:hypothetical protein [Chloroflexota bacterium]
MAEIAVKTKEIWELEPGSRTWRLREGYWQGTHYKAARRVAVQDPGGEGLVACARRFAALLAASEPFIQPDELIVGSCLALPEQERFDLGYYDSHYPPGYALLLPRGLASIRDEARERLKGETDPERREFLRAVEISYAAACEYVARYAARAQELAAVEADPTRRAELERIAAICRELSIGKPTTFHAALQLVQFVRVLGGRGCIGRFDQWLYPFLADDLAAGRLDLEEALELVECAFIKMNEFGAYGEPGVFAVSNDSLRNIALAGQTPDGKDAANLLTYLCLRASGRLMLPEPKLNVRFFAGSPPELLEMTAKVISLGGNVVAVYNDEVAVPALLRLGIPPEDARDYCNDGCEELIIGGKCTIQFRVWDSLTALTDAARFAGEHPFASFGEFLSDVKRRLAPYIENRMDDRSAITFPFFAATIADCLAQASAKGARYKIEGSILAQVGNTADGLAAIRKLVFEEGVLSQEELAAALRDEYRGREALRQMILNRSPKYGNDQDGVDALAREIAEYFCDQVHARAANVPGPGRKGAPGLMCFGIHRKADLPASPDGRRKGDLTANSFSPAVGMDRSGPTAVLKSAAKTDATKASHGSTLDIALHTSVFRGEEGVPKVAALIETFLRLPCTATLQLNVLDRETLLRAREHPDAPEFRTLIVRVWGFSAVFVDLPPELQDHVLARTEHGL